MRGEPTTSTLPSLLSTAETDPYRFYDEVRAAGDVVWDEPANAWLVTSDAAIRQIMLRDNDLVRHPAADTDDRVLHTVLGGPRSRLLLHDDAHARHHRWFVRRFTYNVVNEWRTTLLRPILGKVLDPVVPTGRAELVADLCDRFSVRVIAAVLGLPWQDDEWVVRCKALLDSKQRYINAFFRGADEETERDALAAVAEMDELLLPHVRAARAREPDEADVMAMLWAEGESINPGWSEEDVLAWVTTTFFAGTDTTTHGIANACYLVATVDGLADQLRDGGRDELEAFTEEIMRLYPAVQFINRLANRDFEAGGVTIRTNDSVMLLDAGAGRDPARHPDPHAVDLARADLRKHLGFSIGPRMCAGAALARGEIQEAVGAVVERMPNLRLDPDAPPPRLAGFLARSFEPLHVLFDGEPDV